MATFGDQLAETRTIALRSKTATSELCSDDCSWRFRDLGLGAMVDLRSWSPVGPTDPHMVKTGAQPPFLHG